MHCKKSLQSLFFNSWRENTLIWNSIFQLRGKWAGWWQVTTSRNEAMLHNHYITAAKKSFVTNKLIGLHKLQMPRSLNLTLLRNRKFMKRMIIEHKLLTHLQIINTVNSWREILQTTTSSNCRKSHKSTYQVTVPVFSLFTDTVN